MPNHIHGIIQIVKSDSKYLPVGVQNFEPLQANIYNGNQFQHIIPRSIGCIVRGYKIGVTKWYRVRIPGMVVWQRNYYEHVIQNADELKQIRNYIIENPRKWVELNGHNLH